MAKDHYVDNSELEVCWFKWILSKSTPALEPYRAVGILWTRPTRFVTEDGSSVARRNRNGDILYDPWSKGKKHIIALGDGFEFSSYDGEVETQLPLEMPFETQIKNHGYPAKELCAQKGFVQEVPEQECWKQLTQYIYLMCNGIAMKLNQRTEDDRGELAHAAWQAVADKLKRDKLSFTPGKAPAFNLLTTTIHRCMFSILSRSTRQQRNNSKLIEGVANGLINHDGSLRSLRFTSPKVSMSGIRAQ